MKFDQENTEEIDLEIERQTPVIISQSAIIEKIGYWLVKHTNTHMLLDLLQAKRTITGVLLSHVFVTVQIIEVGWRA